MIDKCANPACSSPFRSLRDGRVFVKEVEGDASRMGRASSRRLSYFWLCNSCCHTMTVIVEGNDVKVRPMSVSLTFDRQES